MESKLIAEALDWIRSRTEVPAPAIRSDTNLIEQGVLDSVGLLDLVEFIEGKAGRRIDLAAADPDQLASVEGLFRCLGAVPEPPSPRVSDERAIRAYSEHAVDYAREEGHSCWGRAADGALAKIRLEKRDGLLVEIGCGTGRALVRLAPSAPPSARIVGIEPAPRLRKLAARATAGCAGVRIVSGRFEELPLDSGTVDYVFSLYAFHWTTDVTRSIDELARVLRPEGELDLIFTGRHTGDEFTAKTTPVLLRYMGVNRLLESTGIRVHLDRAEAHAVFARRFDEEKLTVEESFETHHDTLENHWAWFVARASAHFENVPVEEKAGCEAALREAIGSLREERGIPYTVHTLHVRKSA